MKKFAKKRLFKEFMQKAMNRSLLFLTKNGPKLKLIGVGRDGVKFQVQAVDRIADDGGHFLGVIGEMQKIKVIVRDGALFHKRIFHPSSKALPIFGAHQDNGEVIKLARLDESGRFRKFIQRSESSGQDDESVRIFDKHHLAHEKIIEGDGLMEKRVGFLFMGQHDIAADGLATRFLGAAIRGFHDSRAASCHHRETIFSQSFTDLHRESVIRMAFIETRGAENRDRGSYPVQRAEAADEFERDLENSHGFFEGRVSSRKEVGFVVFFPDQLGAIGRGLFHKIE